MCSNEKKDFEPLHCFSQKREGHTRSKSEDSPSVFPSSDLQIGRDRSRPQTSARYSIHNTHLPLIR